MADERKDVPDDDIDPAWLADPLSAKVKPTPETKPPAATPPPSATPPPEPPPGAPPQHTPRPAPLIPQMDPRGRAPARPEPEPEPEETETEPEGADGGEGAPEEETVRLPERSGSPGVTIALFVAMALGGALVWHFTAPARALNRGLTLLFRAQRTGDPQAAASALKALKGYVDQTGQGYDRLFEAAAQAGDEATAAAYEDALMKAPPPPGAALLAWYESALRYHAVFAQREKDAYDASTDPAERKALADKIRAHQDAAKALKPTRAKVVEEFDNGFAAPEAARLLRIDAMHRDLEALDAAALLAAADKPAGAPPKVSTAAASAALSTTTAAAVSTAPAKGAATKTSEPDL